MKLRPKYRLVEHFAEIDDPRIERTKRHKLIDILTIAILAVICGADSWVGMESFGAVGISNVPRFGMSALCHASVLSWLWLHFLPPLKVLLSLMEGIVAGSILIGFAATVIFGLAVTGLRRLFSMHGISFIKSVSLLILTPNPLWLHAHNIFSDYIVSNSLSTLISTFLHNFCQSIRLKAIVKRRSRAESPSSATVSNLTLTFFHLFFRFSYS